MVKGLIKFCSTKVIDANSSGIWDKRVFEDTYKEFFMQAQQFDQQKKYKTFQEILKNVPKADGMHYLVSTAAIGYIRQLNARIPDAFNTTGKPCLPFKNFKFEILQSHVQDKRLHKVVIYFYSDELIWIDTIDKSLLFAHGAQIELLQKGDPVETETLVVPPDAAICSFRLFSPTCSQGTR